MTYTPDDVQQLRDAYDGAIAYIDDQIGNLIEELDRRGALDNTLLIVTADHGEEFLEHGVMGHSQSLYSSALHVPLIIRFPGHVPQGQRIGHTVGLRQVAATVADLLGLGSTPFTGRSLVEEWVSASRGDSISSEPVFAEAIAKTYTLPDHYPISRGTIRSIVWNDLHYIRGPGEVEELYDLRNDPFEQDDLWMKTETLGLVDLIRAAYDQAERRTRSRQ
jgi:arylsulfatase A-like enzyme